MIKYLCLFIFILFSCSENEEMYKPHVYNLINVKKLNRQQKDVLLSKLDSLIKVYPEEEEQFLNKKADVYISLKEYNNAFQMVDSVLEIDSLNVFAFIMKCKIYKALKDEKKLKLTYENIVNILDELSSKSNDSKYPMMKIEYLSKLGRFEEAIDIYQNNNSPFFQFAKGIDPDTPKYVKEEMMLINKKLTKDSIR